MSLSRGRKLEAIGWRVGLEYHLENDQNILHIQHGGLCSFARLPHKPKRSLLETIMKEQVCAIQAIEEHIEEQPSDYIISPTSGLMEKKKL